MMKIATTRTLMILMLAFLPVLATAGDDEAHEQMMGLVAMCDASADARSARHAETPLFERLGGYDKVLDLCQEIVRLHQENDDFRLMMGYVDGDHLAKQVADFVSTGTGGPKVYKGSNMVDAHAHLQFTEADFLSAGGDVIQAMKNKGYGEDEINEFVCILVSMKDMVIK